MRERLVLASVIVVSACADSTSEMTSSEVRTCPESEIAPICDAPTQSVTGHPTIAGAPAIDVGVTYTISRGYVLFTPATSGTYTVHFDDGAPVRVCDLTAVCSSRTSACLPRAARYAMEAGVTHEIEIRGPSQRLQIVEPIAPPPSDALIVFAAALDGQAAPDLYTLDPSNGTTTRLTSTPGAELYPTWSPDRTRIAFVRDFQLFATDADGSNEQLLAATTGRERMINDFVYSTTLGPAAWSPDGSELAYLFPREPRIFTDGDDVIDQSYATTIHIVDADGTNDRAIATDPGFTINSLAWAANGMLSYSQADDCPDCASGQWVGVSQPDGSGYEQVLFATKQVDWSSDSTRWTFVEGGDNTYDTPGTVVTSPALMDDTTQVATSAWNPRWSPDDAQVAYIGGDGIYVGSQRVLAVTNVRGIDW